MSEEYLLLLDRAFSKMPQNKSSGERFEIPKTNLVRIGRKSIIQNFSEICDKLNRENAHVLKFLSKEMGTSGSFDGTRAIFPGRFYSQNVSRLLEIYCQRYVTCPICKRPDTKMIKEGRFYFLSCEACGAKSSVHPT